LRSKSETSAGCNPGPDRNEEEDNPVARYTGPKHRLCRRISQCLWADPTCPSKKKAYPPGEAGKGRLGGRRPRKQSNYGIHLQEKQKLRMTYGLLERQFRNTFHRAQNMRGVAGDNFLQILERRLDNMVYRLGFAPSIFAARQAVNHGHIRVDDKKVDIPSFIVNVGQTIRVKEKSRKIPMFVESAERRNRTIPDYLECQPEELAGRLLVMPRAEDIPIKVDTNLIVEFYSR
jgi:small subunit ribosomal protein S4